MYLSPHAHNQHGLRTIVYPMFQTYSKNLTNHMNHVVGDISHDILVVPVKIPCAIAILWMEEILHQSVNDVSHDNPTIYVVFYSYLHSYQLAQDFLWFPKMGGTPKSSMSIASLGSPHFTKSPFLPSIIVCHYE